jgi:predicted SAM-dependent methyltransferase
MRTHPLPTSDGVKIVIGTRTWYDDTWIHIDIDPTPLLENDEYLHPVDIVSDARNIPLPDEYADLVFSTEAIEHFPWRETGDVIEEWARLLKKNGKLVVEAPDFILAAQQILATETLEHHLAMQQIFFAEQLNKYDVHYAGLTHLTLPHYFELAGLTVTEVKRGDECGWLRVTGIKG